MSTVASQVALQSTRPDALLSSVCCSHTKTCAVMLVLCGAKWAGCELGPPSSMRSAACQRWHEEAGLLSRLAWGRRWCGLVGRAAVFCFQRLGLDPSINFAPTCVNGVLGPAQPHGTLPPAHLPASHCCCCCGGCAALPLPAGQAVRLPIGLLGLGLPALRDGHADGSF